MTVVDPNLCPESECGRTGSPGKINHIASILQFAVACFMVFVRDMIRSNLFGPLINFDSLGHNQTSSILSFPRKFHFTPGLAVDYHLDKMSRFTFRVTFPRFNTHFCQSTDAAAPNDSVEKPWSAPRDARLIYDGHSLTWMP